MFSSNWLTFGCFLGKLFSIYSISSSSFTSVFLEDGEEEEDEDFLVSFSSSPLANFLPGAPLEITSSSDLGGKAETEKQGKFERLSLHLM